MAGPRSLHIIMKSIHTRKLCVNKLETDRQRCDVVSSNPAVRIAMFWSKQTENTALFGVTENARIYRSIIRADVYCSHLDGRRRRVGELHEPA